MVFPAPVGPTMAMVVPGSHVGCEIDDEGFVEGVAEVDVTQTHDGRRVSAGRRRRDDREIRRLVVGVQELEDSFGRCDARLQHVHLAGDLGHGHRELSRVLDEGSHRPQTQHARRHPIPSEHGDRRVVDVGDGLHRGLDEAREELGPDTCLVQGSIVPVELLNGGVATPEDLHQLVTGMRLFH